jgi:hypothetical protein
LTAPWLIEGAMDRPAFDLYIETQLAPTLQPGDVVILDNPRYTHRPRPQPRSKSVAPGSCSCRPIRPISIRSRWPSPN